MALLWYSTLRASGHPLFYYPFAPVINLTYNTFQMKQFISANQLTERILSAIDGKPLSEAEALAAVAYAQQGPEQLDALCHAADMVRERTRGNRFGTCSIINARSGRCSEDCKWCAQSHVHHTGIKEYPLIDAQEAIDMALHNAAKGVDRFSLVTSGRTLTPSQADHVVDIFRQVGAKANIDLCASLGLLTRDQLQALHAVGVHHYHCNIETAPSYFPHLCSTHTLQDKLQTIGWAREVGMLICSGGIIGMGETLAQRVEMAIFLRDVVKADSIPLNVLIAIKGTALENQQPLQVDEIRLTFAIFRICNPKAELRMAGGRIRYVDQQQKVIACGVDSSIVGEMLTTTGTGGIDDDMATFHAAGRTTKADEK